MSDLGGAVDEFANEFVDKIKVLKSLVLLRSSQPSAGTDKVLEDLDAALTKAERSMNTLKCKLAEECQLLRYVEEFEALSNRQARQVEHIRANLGPTLRHRLLEVQRSANSHTFAEEHPSTCASKENAGPNIVQASASFSGCPDIPKSQAVALLRRLGESEFDKTPQYVRGRVTLDKARAAVMGMPMSKLSDVQLKQVRTWKDLEAEDSRGLPVLADSDLKGTGLRAGEPGSREVMGVLKHSQRLKEIASSRADGAGRAFVCLCAPPPH